MEFIAELVGFVLIVFVLWRYVLPLVAKMVKNRQDDVQRQVDEAEDATRKLNDAQGRLDNAIERSEAEAARIRDDARADATRIREELTEQAEAEVERMKQRGRDQLVSNRDQAVRRLRGDLSGASMELAERVVRNNLEDDSARSYSVERFLSEIENLSAPRESTRVPTGGGD